MADDETTETSETDEATEEQADDIDAIKAALKKANDEAKSYRLKVKELQPLAEAAKKAEDEKKSEVERLTEQIGDLTKQRDAAVSKADRLEVAISKSLDEDRVQRINTAVKRLTGTTREELEADADELLPLLFPSETEETKPNPTSKPREQLKPGNGDPDLPVEETDVKKLGERMFAS